MSLEIFEMLHKVANTEGGVVRTCLTCIKPFIARKNEFYCTWCSGKSKTKPQFKTKVTRHAENRVYYES